MNESPLLELRGLTTSFPIRAGILQRQVGTIQAVHNVDLSLGGGETVGLVGESGSGKSTLARTIMGLEIPSSGQVILEGQDITHLDRAERRKIARKIQMVFQDPYSSLNPRMTAYQLIAEGWQINKGVVSPDRQRDRGLELLELVGLNADHADRYPHQFSGGQRQRVAIARALALEPRVLVCDEAVSALDVSVQAQVLNLLDDLQKEFDLSYLFVAHDLSVVRHIADRIAVMYMGTIVEAAATEDLYQEPEHPYTVSLMSAVPELFPWETQRASRIVLTGDLPSPSNPPSGCRFRTRCWKAESRCSEIFPDLQEVGGSHYVACLYPVQADSVGGASSSGIGMSGDG